MLNRRKALAAIGASAGLAMPYVRRARAASGTVNVYNWSDYIGEHTLADFTAETGVKVVYDLYSSSEEMEAKMLAGSTGYDVVLQGGVKLPMMIKAGVYQQLDKSKLSNWSNLDTDVLRIFEGFDPGSQYGVPYTWGSVGFTYNLEMVNKRLPNADLANLDTIFKAENAQQLAECGLSILDSPTDVGPMALKYLGLDPDTAGPEEYKKVVELFAPIRPYIPPSTMPII